MNDITKKPLSLEVSLLVMYLVANILLVLVIFGFNRVIGFMFVSDGEFTPSYLAGVNLISSLVIASVLVFTARHYLPVFFNDLKNNSKEVIKYIGLGFLIIIGISLVVNIILTGALGELDTPQNQALLENIANYSLFSKVSLFIFAVILAPITEELVYRKAIFGLASKYLGGVAAIFISGLAFGFVHVLSEPTNLVSLAPYFAMGLGFGLVYYLSKERLTVVIPLHMLWNLIAVGVLLLGVDIG